MVTINSNKWIDIASHYNYYICIAQTKDWVYVWGACAGIKDTYIMPLEELKQTIFKTFEQFYNNFFGISYEPNDKSIDFKTQISITESGKYCKDFKDPIELGGGQYGKVVKVKSNYSSNECAIKIMKFTSENEANLLKEVQTFNTINRILTPGTVKFIDLWLENNSESVNGNKNGLILYIQMELCDTTLETVINQMHRDPYICTQISGQKTFTLLGFYIASRIFVQILKGVNRLHKHQIFHCDLHSGNVLLKKDYDCKREKYEIHVKIVDFGLARICVLAQKSETVLPKGNSKYCLSQVSSDGSYTSKADIHALEYIMRQLFCIDTFR
jgi:serine/threonine protein kinase